MSLFDPLLICATYSTLSLSLSGNINMSAGKITWGDNIPNKQRYAASKNGPWHDSMLSGDIWCCDWNYKTQAWGEPYKKVGQDGKNGSNGSDATVNYNNIKAALKKASSITDAFMSVNEMGAPEIFGGKIYGAEIYAGGVGKKGGQIIGLTSGGIDIFDGRGEKSLGISAEGDGVNLTTGFKYMALNTPYLNLEGTNTTFFRGLSVDFTGVKEADFTGVKTKGLHVTFA